MNPDLERVEKLLEANLELAKENKRMIKSLWRHQRVMKVVRIIYFLLFLAAAFGIYYYLDPYIEQVSEFYTGSKDSFDRVKGLLENIPNGGI